MFLQDGSPSLVGMTRQYAGDPAGAARPLWPDKEVIGFINTAYSDLLDLARIMGLGWEHKVTYDTAVSGTQFYNAPDDNRRILEVMISTTGQDLSTTSPANASMARLTFMDDATVEPEYRANRITSLKYWTMRGTQYGIFDVPGDATVGANSIQLLYEGESPLLAQSSDEPIFPRDTHNAIALRAGVLLRLTKSLPVADLREEARLADIRFRSSVRTFVSQADTQVTVAGVPVEMGLDTASGMTE